MASGADLGPVMVDWTGLMYAEHGAVEHLDITARATVYRVFLLASTLRHGVPAAQGRGVDRLPPEVTAPLAGALVRSLDGGELARAFRVATRALLAEAGHADAGLARRLADPLR